MGRQRPTAFPPAALAQAPAITREHTMPAAIEPTSLTTQQLGIRLAVGLCWIVVMLHGVSGLGRALDGAAVAGWAFAAAATGVFLLPWRQRLRWPLMLLVGAGASAVFFLWRAPFDPRLARPMIVTSVGYAYAAFWLATAVSLLTRRVNPGVFLAAALLAGGVIKVESVATSLHAVPPKVVHWIGGTAPHSTLEEYYPPNTTASTRYIANPRNYFHPVDARLARWSLGLNDPSGASKARLVLPDDPKQDRVRVEIEGNPAQVPWHVQLAFAPVQVKQGQQLLLALRVRADKPRTLGVSVAQNRAPWHSLGIYSGETVGTAWRDVVLSFTADADDGQARIVFDLGQDQAAVEIEAVQLRLRATSESVVTPLATEYSVDFRFNNQGCRGVSLPETAGAGRRRVLVLGDSFALGVGVHEADTLSVKLQGLLNARSASARYEVVNCSVSGFATQQERQMYEIQAPHYRPELVILAMVENDYVSWRQDVARGTFFQPEPVDVEFKVLGLVRMNLKLRDKPPVDFSPNLQELLKLGAQVRRDGGRLLVVSFRNNPLNLGNWDLMARTISAGLLGTDIAWLDLGEALLKGRDWHDLLVYPNGDWHPNEIAHRLAAEQIDRHLQDLGWLR